MSEFSGSKLAAGEQTHRSRPEYARGSTGSSHNGSSNFMGTYLNPDNDGFRQSLNSKIYVDKTGLIAHTNAFLQTQQKYLCISRPRRFGKSMALDMLAAYYSRGADSDPLFQGLSASTTDSYREHLNRYDVLCVNMQEFLSRTQNAGDMIQLLERRILAELKREYPDGTTEDDFLFAMQDIYAATRRPFVILIDEWDCLFREYHRENDQRKYLDFLRMWLKDQKFAALVYMTGILPIKKYGTHSALNMFYEYSMTDPGDFSQYFGFTESEVRSLCSSYQMNFEEAKDWYDGYRMPAGKSGSGTSCQSEFLSMYNPKSVVEALLRRSFNNYWNRTETYQALKIYIQMNMDGLKDAIVSMLGGGKIHINTDTFSNDMTTFSTKDDVLTLLVHLGYLNYDCRERTVSIPNKEVAQEYVNAISTMDWVEVSRSIQESRELLTALWNMDAETVAQGVEHAHYEASVITYNDENSLSCTIHLAFYVAREYYTILREFPTGKGFADICFIPRREHAEKPAAVIELKWDKTAKGALAQIKERNYPESLRDYHGDLLLAGINYDPKSKKHTCVIEKMVQQS